MRGVTSVNGVGKKTKRQIVAAPATDTPADKAHQGLLRGVGVRRNTHPPRPGQAEKRPRKIPRAF